MFYLILTNQRGHLFNSWEATRDSGRARTMADDAVYGMGYHRALVLAIPETSDQPTAIDSPVIHDTDTDPPYRNCPRCSGHGRYQIAVDDDTECEGCNGTGHTDTPERWVTCPSCNGTRRLDGYPCYACDATGVQEDWEAHF